MLFLTSVVYTSARKKTGLDAPVAITCVIWQWTVADQ
jgi:hypothetical protein